MVEISYCPNRTKGQQKSKNKYVHLRNYLLKYLMIFQYSLYHYIAVMGFCFHFGNMKNFILILNTTVAQVSDQQIIFWDWVNSVHLVLSLKHVQSQQPV